MLGPLVLASMLAAGCTGPPHGWIPCRPEIDQFCDNCRCGRFHLPPGLHGHAAQGGHTHAAHCQCGQCERESPEYVGLLDNVGGQCKCTCESCAGKLCGCCHEECCERSCACDPNCTDAGCEQGGCATGGCASCSPTDGAPCDCEACKNSHHAHKKIRLPKLYDPEAGILNFCTPPLALTTMPPPPPGRFFPVPVKPVFSPQPVYQVGYGAAGYGASGYGSGNPGAGAPGACPQ